MPRLALASSHSGEEPSAITLALLHALKKKKPVQYFASQARPLPEGVVERVTDRPGRHLDSWLMPREVLHRVFARGARASAISVVEGAYGNQTETICLGKMGKPGALTPLIEALDLPTIAVLDVENAQVPHLVHPAGRFDALFLDRVPSVRVFEELSVLAEAVYRRPVLGGLEDLSKERAVLARTDRRGLDETALERLGLSFQRLSDLRAIEQLASSRPFPAACDQKDHEPCHRGMRVAYARDAAFGRYFPDTLEALETMGAELIEFSPLADEKLPERVDLILIGCGFADEHAAQLAGNYSLISDLQMKVCQGIRLYAEGGGAAYLGQTMVVGTQQYAMAGILPFHAVALRSSCCATPVTQVLCAETWLGATGAAIQGYRTLRWRFIPALEVHECMLDSGRLTGEGDMYYHKNAVGGLIHLHLGAVPALMRALTQEGRKAAESTRVRHSH
jgi:cobyrinic acid a,c-diamide synthase